MLKYALAVSAILLATPVSAAPSVCKGLDEAACSGNAVCKWRSAVKAGDQTKAGTPAKRNVKAHCRKAPAPKGKA